MSKKLTKEYFQSFENTSDINTPFFEGKVINYNIDNLFSIEKQDILMKEDILYEDVSNHSHLEFNFPILGRAEVELNKRYLNSKAPLDMFSFSAFNNKSSALFIEKNQTIKQLSINLNPKVYFKSLPFNKNIIANDTNLFKVSGSNTYLENTVE